MGNDTPNITAYPYNQYFSDNQTKRNDGGGGGGSLLSNFVPNGCSAPKPIVLPEPTYKIPSSSIENIDKIIDLCFQAEIDIGNRTFTVTNSKKSLVNVLGINTMIDNSKYILKEVKILEYTHPLYEQNEFKFMYSVYPESATKNIADYVSTTKLVQNGGMKVNLNETLIACELLESKKLNIFITCKNNLLKPVQYDIKSIVTPTVTTESKNLEFAPKKKIVYCGESMVSVSSAFYLFYKSFVGMYAEHLRAIGSDLDPGIRQFDENGVRIHDDAINGFRNVLVSDVYSKIQYLSVNKCYFEMDFKNGVNMQDNDTLSYYRNLLKHKYEHLKFSEDVDVKGSLEINVKVQIKIVRFNEIYDMTNVTDSVQTDSKILNVLNTVELTDPFRRTQVVERKYDVKEVISKPEIIGVKNTKVDISLKK
jgi:hypothetical protein